MLRELDINEMNVVSGGDQQQNPEDEIIVTGTINRSTGGGGVGYASFGGGGGGGGGGGVGVGGSPANQLYNDPEWRAQVQQEAEGAQRVLAGITVATLVGAGSGGWIGAAKGLATGVAGAYAGAWFNVYNYDP